MPIRHLIALAALGGMLAACAGDPSRPRMTPAEQSDFADVMIQSDPLTSGEIPSAGSFPNR